MEAFAIFCGMGIHNTHMYEKAIVAMAKQSVTLEVLSYHASATMDEAHRLRVSSTAMLTVQILPLGVVRPMACVGAWLAGGEVEGQLLHLNA